MSKLIVFQDNEKIVLVDGTTIEIDTGMFNNPLGFIVTEAAEHSVQADGAKVSGCTCNAYQLENFGCKCGAANPPLR